jgi:multiple sugar transport system ATP-binding protein
LFEGVTKIFDDGTVALRDLNLEVEDGSFMVLVGPSGCGKTTALRMVAGLEEITYGSVSVGDRQVNDLAPKERDIAMVFQNYALYPHLTVFENIAFGLRLRHFKKPDINERVDRSARMLDLYELLKRKPGQLSGGQRQRVAMGRAIVREPKAFLMDEPLSNLDAKLRVQMRTEISKLQREVNVTTVFVTHDQVEAMTMGDRVAVLKLGVLQQVDAPSTLYRRPANLFVAGFIGSPAMNMVEATIEKTSSGMEAVFGSFRLRLDDSIKSLRPALEAFVGRKVILGIRPEDMEDASIHAGAPEDQKMRAEVYVHFTVDTPPVVTEDTKELAADRGIAAEEMEATHSPFVARFDADTRAGEGDRVEVFVDTKALYFFDLETGMSIYDKVPTAPQAAVSA